MKVYIVTSGCYDSYCIERVFLDDDKAKECAQYIPDSRVEEFEITETVPKKFLCIRMETTITNKPCADLSSPKVKIQIRFGGADTEWCWEHWNHALSVGMIRYFPAEEYDEFTSMNLCQKEFKNLITKVHNLWFAGLKDFEITKKLREKE